MSEDRGPIRDSSLYVSWQTRKGLGYVPKDTDQTIDGLAEKILSGWLKENYPQVVDHMKAQYETDQEFKKNLSPKPF